MKPAKEGWVSEIEKRGMGWLPRWSHKRPVWFAATGRRGRSLSCTPDKAHWQLK
jgi:hypothetical protein